MSSVKSVVIPFRTVPISGPIVTNLVKPIKPLVSVVGKPGKLREPILTTSKVVQNVPKISIPPLNTSTYKPIQLKYYQEDHFKRMDQILKHNLAAMDVSKTGRGKTYTTSALASYYGLPILLISPPSIFGVWKSIQNEHGISILDTLSYDKLRGRKGSPCNHKYLTRNDSDQFQGTNKLRELFNSGILIVFDEMDKLKNQNTGAKAAAHALIRCLHENPKTKSRVILLSALPGDKPVHSISLMQVLGIIQDEKAYNYDNITQKYERLGIQEAINWCFSRDKVATRQICAQYPVDNKKSIPELALKLFKDVVRQQITSCMLKDEDEEPLDIKNGYYWLSSDDENLLREGEQTLSRALRYNEDGLVTNTNVNWGEVTKALKYLSLSKLRTMARLGFDKLKETPNSKGVIGTWYIDHIMWLKKAFKDYGAQVLYGGVTPIEREKIIAKFQEPNNDCRVLIINPTVGGIGINLDDRFGNRPRFMLLTPDYRMSSIVQSTGRIYRESTISKKDTQVRIIYSKQFHKESKILTSLLKKSEHSRDMITNDTGLALPDTYGQYKEDYPPKDFHLDILPSLPLDKPSTKNTGRMIPIERDGNIIHIIPIKGVDPKLLQNIKVLNI